MSNDVKFHPEDSAPWWQLLPHLYLFKVVSRTSHVQRRTRKAGQGARAGGGAGSRGPTTSRFGVRAALRVRKPAPALASVLAKARRLRLIQVQHRKQLNCAESAHACACVHACAHVCVCACASPRSVTARWWLEVGRDGSICGNSFGRAGEEPVCQLTALVTVTRGS